MAKHVVTTVHHLDISPNELAEMFWSMDCYEQVQFFEHLGRVCSDSYKRQMQFLGITENSTPEAREVMSDLGLAAQEMHFDE